MRTLYLLAICLAPSLLYSQTTNQWARAFPITDYMVDANDSIKIVQVHPTDGTTIPEKQLGLLKGMYRDKHDIEEAAQLADRVVVLSSRPAYICKELRIDSPKPRNLTDQTVIDAMKTILDELGLRTEEHK